MERLTDLEVIRRIKLNFQTDYSIKEIPADRTEPAKLICPHHGAFTKKVQDLLRNVGCNACAKQSTADKLAMPLQQVLEKASSVHNFKYDYSKVIYKNMISKVLIICPLHGQFHQTMHAHINSKQGCAECSKKLQGYSKTVFKNYCIKNNNGFGILYVIRCFNENEEFYKIGRTSNKIKTRFNSSEKMPYQYEIIQEIKDVSDNIFELEYYLHNIFKKLEKQYLPKLIFKGYKECYKI